MQRLPVDIKLAEVVIWLMKSSKDGNQGVKVFESLKPKTIPVHDEDEFVSTYSCIPVNCARDGRS